VNKLVITKPTRIDDAIVAIVVKGNIVHNLTVYKAREPFMPQSVIEPLSKAEIITLTRDDFMTAISADSRLEIVKAIMAVTVRQELGIFLHIMPTNMQIAHMLLAIADEKGRARITHKKLSKLLNASRENITAILTNGRAFPGIIKRGYGWIDIDPQQVSNWFFHELGALELETKGI